MCDRRSSFLICDDCLNKIDTKFERCKICSRPIRQANGICLGCLKGKNYFSKGFSLFDYKDGISNKIIEFIKFYGYPRVADIIFRFSKEIAESGLFMNDSCIVPVPMHRKDIKKRGFNQSVVISKRLSKITGLKICFDCVEKQKFTKKQVGLSAYQRKENLKDAFKLLRKPTFKRVVIVDDVFTTGSTINELCKLFKRSGVECFFFTLAATPNELD